MGWSPLDIDKPKSRSCIGDEPFDAISDSFSQVCRLYQRDWKRKPTLKELVGTVEAVLDAQLHEHTKDGATSELIDLSYRVRKIPKRQQYVAGDVLQAKLKDGDLIFARIFSIDDGFPMVGVYDSKGMSPLDIAGIISKPLIVKVCPIHPGNLEKRAWVVLQNCKLIAKDKRRPRGPIAITGNNNQLEMAEHYYGLRKSKNYDVDEWIVDK
ncbi:hypothetical protein SAMN06265222_1364 [Neorhodopirellula lusitana]|uniref:Uncharacterized protein n=1 Tax=Neorhodopirellula lusitana TaxID=445327 RepID=A0ABY1QTN0_9BACT|nr:hypothetical protein [Neorhodopirellula lusitana]SMP79634.1 hypothetical protein SAMN06265222_1364 [Neorhodopirellula lusitana]